MPLSPVDLIKNHILAQAEKKHVMSVDDAFKMWNEMLTNLGDNYANHERFLRHYYNAFKADLPEVPKAPVATKASLIRIYETLASLDLADFIGGVVHASAAYGRVTGVVDEARPLDEAFRQLNRAQGAPSYMLLLWLLQRRVKLAVDEQVLEAVVADLVDFFVRRNLTGYPQTYALPRLFMETIAEPRCWGAGRRVGSRPSPASRGISLGRGLPRTTDWTRLRRELRCGALRPDHAG